MAQHRVNGVRHSSVVHSRAHCGMSGRLFDGFDDADLALGAVGEHAERLLVGGAVVRRYGVVNAGELDEGRTVWGSETLSRL